MINSLKKAVLIAGPLSTPSKMPGYAYGIPAKACGVGSVLAQVAGSVCEKCYALKGRYTWPTVVAAQNRRLTSLRHPLWTEAMVYQIKHYNNKYFRWHDSGDLQGMWHLIEIVEIAYQCPDIHFWLPTRERGLVSEYTRTMGPFPDNLLVRLSATMIDGPPPAGFPHTSTVVRNKDVASCPAQYQGNACVACRKCWDPKVPNVSYPKH